MTYTLYGIPNCDTVKKARSWLEQHAIEYTFHDYKKLGVTAAALQRWQTQAGTALILNTRGTTWRKLEDADRADISEAKAVQLMQTHPSLIKRPVLEGNNHLLVGFKLEDWQSLL